MTQPKRVKTARGGLMAKKPSARLGLIWIAVILAFLLKRWRFVN